MTNISPRYQMSLVKDIEKTIWEIYHSYDDVLAYVEKWHEVYDCFGDNENFYIKYRDKERKKIDLKNTLHAIDGDTLIKIAVDLGLATPDFIPSIPTFKNEIKSSYETAAQTFEKAYSNVEENPSIAIGLANSALESVIKEILKDQRIKIQWDQRETLSKLIGKICKAFRLDIDKNCPPEIKCIASSLIAAGKAIEDLRSDKTELHGKTDDDYIITDSLYAYFVINSITTVGLFLLSFYKKKFPIILPTPFATVDTDLPF